jgi:hypothetical protein
MALKIIASNAGINPTLLGVSSRWIDSDPTASRMPPRLNPDCQDIWATILTGDLYIERRRALRSHERWSLAVQLFLRECDVQSINPFGNVLDNTSNNRIISRLTRSRLTVCKYLDNTALLNTFTVRDAWREVKLTDKGFILRSWAKATYEGMSAIQLEAMLRSPAYGFQPMATSKGKTLAKMLDASVWVFVTIKNSMQVTLHYRMVIDQVVYHPGVERGKSITLPELRAWIERVIWLPIVRTHHYTKFLRKTSF